MARVLVVDDALMMRKKITYTITDSGHEVIGEAKDGQEAIEMYNTLKPDLITMDITMDGMDGITATRKLCESYPDIKIIVSSSHSNQETIDLAMAAGAKGYLVKPFQKEEFINLVKDVL